MKKQLVPPVELAPPSIKHLPFEKSIELWAQLVDESEAFLIAALKAKVGENGDWQEAYRQWNRRRMEERDAKWVRFAKRMSRLEPRNDK